MSCSVWESYRANTNAHRKVTGKLRHRYNATARDLSLTVLVVAAGFVVILDAIPDLLLAVVVTTISVIILDAELLLVAFCRKKTNML